MNSLFFDTNVFVRFFIKDNAQQYAEIVSLLEAIERGRLVPYISTVVLLELQYILRKKYNVPKKTTIEYIRRVLDIRSLVIVEETNIHRALDLHAQTGVKLADCLIAEQVPAHCILCTYDQDFGKFNLRVKSPQKISEEESNYKI